MKRLIRYDKQRLLRELWQADSRVRDILGEARNLHNARGRLMDYLNSLEDKYFNITSGMKIIGKHIIERNNAKECIRVFKNILRTENEKLTGCSALQHLYNLARYPKASLEAVHEGFLCELIFLFWGINANSGILPERFGTLRRDVAGDAQRRSKHLDRYARHIRNAMKRYRTGFDKEQRKARYESTKKILEYFGATRKEWQDYRWHFKHLIRDLKTLQALARLSDDEEAGIKAAAKYGIPFQITPHYLSLFTLSGRNEYDRILRAQVIPSVDYCKKVKENRDKGIDLDFMGERATSPVPAITRRYPQIVILKPFDSCPQICVYCQRNWEIKESDSIDVRDKDISRALSWLTKNTEINEVLVTGGDPLMLRSSRLDALLGKLAQLRHIERIRIGTRMLVTLPFRFDDELLDVFKKYHELGKREVCIITHIESPLEITGDVLNAVKRIKALGISIHNQQVFTYYNSRHYESSHLRKVIRRCGIEPYYTFNTKGKEETTDFRVPIARLQQEMKEESRLMPGLVRTDNPVFNVPRLGKSNLRAWQDHEPIMLLPNGRRVYRFYPWESRLDYADDYIYTDVSIYDYLKRLYMDAEDIGDYQSIWYYF